MSAAGLRHFLNRYIFSRISRQSNFEATHSRSCRELFFWSALAMFLAPSTPMEFSLKLTVYTKEKKTFQRININVSRHQGLLLCICHSNTSGGCLICFRSRFVEELWCSEACCLCVASVRSIIKLQHFWCDRHFSNQGTLNESRT